MKYIETVIERNEKCNEHGTRIVNELIRSDKVLSNGEIAKGCTEFSWYQTVGEDRATLIVSFKREPKIRKAMNEFGF